LKTPVTTASEGGEGTTIPSVARRQLSQWRAASTVVQCWLPGAAVSTGRSGSEADVIPADEALTICIPALLNLSIPAPDRAGE